LGFFGDVPVGERGDAPVREGDVEIHGVVPFFDVDISKRLSSDDVASFSLREYSLQGSLNVNQYLTAYGKKGWN
jgi:hypothetical protein